VELNLNKQESQKCSKFRKLIKCPSISSQPCRKDRISDLTKQYVHTHSFQQVIQQRQVSKKLGKTTENATMNKATFRIWTEKLEPTQRLKPQNQSGPSNFCQKNKQNVKI
jgi:hypothetical protein